MEAKFFYKNENAPKPNKPVHVGVAAIISNKKSKFFLKEGVIRTAGG